MELANKLLERRVALLVWYAEKHLQRAVVFFPGQVDLGDSKIGSAGRRAQRARLLEGLDGLIVASLHEQRPAQVIVAA